MIPQRVPTYSTNGAVHVIVETPRGSTAKFKYDDERGVMRLSRPLPAGIAYPFDWGFLPGTRAADGDPLDAMVLWDTASYPGIVIAVRVVGVLRVEQNNLQRGGRERNDRLMTIPVNALSGLPLLDARLRSELEQFFTAAVAFEGKDVRLLGWGDPAEGEALVRDSVASAAARADHEQTGRDRYR